jgi:hypothetical protein
MSTLGLEPWGVRHGLVTKLVFRDLDDPLPPGVLQGPPEYGGEHFDVERSLTLYQDVYSFRSLRDRALWGDRPSRGIAINFAFLAAQLSDVAQRSGADAEVVRRLRGDAVAFSLVAEGGTRGRPGV